MRLIRLRSKLSEILQAEGISLLVYEAARHLGPGMQGALVVQSELQATIKLFCEDHGLSYRGYSPSEIKKHATGKGNAGKPLMREAAESVWPDRKFKDDNEIDALWLLDLAVQEYDR
jgi:Holliday junction resolvasome RuvABC endonuclease subunit